jgi:hypothetical protein
MTTTADPVLRRWIHAEHGRYFAGFADRRVLLEAIDASIGHDVAEFAPDITAPTLLVAAARDDIAPHAAQRALLSRFPDARLVVVPAVGPPHPLRGACRRRRGDLGVRVRLVVDCRYITPERHNGISRYTGGPRARASPRCTR